MTKKHTGNKAASKVLEDKRTSKDSKSAGSALAQRDKDTREKPRSSQAARRRTCGTSALGVCSLQRQVRSAS